MLDSRNLHWKKVDLHLEVYCVDYAHLKIKLPFDFSNLQRRSVVNRVPSLHSLSILKIGFKWSSKLAFEAIELCERL